MYAYFFLMELLKPLLYLCLHVVHDVFDVVEGLLPTLVFLHVLHQLIMSHEAVLAVLDEAAEILLMDTILPCALKVVLVKVVEDLSEMITFDAALPTFCVPKRAAKYAWVVAVSWGTCAQGPAPQALS